MTKGVPAVPATTHPPAHATADIDGGSLLVRTRSALATRGEMPTRGTTTRGVLAKVGGIQAVAEELAHSSATTAAMVDAARGWRARGAEARAGRVARGARAACGAPRFLALSVKRANNINGA